MIKLYKEVRVPASINNVHCAHKWIKKQHPTWNIICINRSGGNYEEPFDHNCLVTYTLTNRKWKRSADRKRRAAALGGSL